MNALEIRDLTRHFGDFTLDSLNLTLPGGCILGLIGENGAGKSTTIRLILGMLRPDGGTVTILGRDNRDNLALTKQDIGVVLDEVGIPECMTPKQVGIVMADVFTRWDAKTYEGLLERFSLPENKKFREFSRGMKMKLGLAVALSHEAKLLILDEATSGLDPVVRDEVVSILSEFTRDESHSILISSHIVSDLEKICDYIAFLHSGKLLLCEEKDRLLEEYAVVRLPRERLADLPEDSIVRQQYGAYGAQALVLRNRVPRDLPLERTSLEDIILLLAKGGAQI